MNARRILTLARRVMRQVLRDHRIVGLLVVVPMLVLTLGAILFRSELAAIPLGIVNEDEGLTTPLTGKVVLGQRIADELADGDAFALVTLGRDEIEGANLWVEEQRGVGADRSDRAIGGLSERVLRL